MRFVNIIYSPYRVKKKLGQYPELPSIFYIAPYDESIAVETVSCNFESTILALRMALKPSDIHYCVGDTDVHLDGICSVTEATIGWNYPHVIKTLHSLCPEGIQIAVAENKVVGVCIVTPLDQNEAFVSVLGVDEKYRRRGIATRLFRACEKVLGERNITLYSDEDAIEFYKSVGFKLGNNPSVAYFTNVVPKRDILQDVNDLQQKVQIAPMQSVLFNDLHTYDKNIAMVDRKYWLQSCYDKDTKSVVALDEDNKICGYGVFRPIEAENRIFLQPILAENTKIAKTVLVHLLKKVPEDNKVTLKVPKENVEGVKLMQRIGLDIQRCEIGTDGEIARVMFTKHQVKVPINKVFSLMNGMNQPA